MAATDESPGGTTISTTSYDTALCIIPSQKCCQTIDQLRSLYDKAYGKWPPHVNFVYPFVAPENLQRAKERIESNLSTNFTTQRSPKVVLNQAGLFKHTKNSTVIIQEHAPEETTQLATLRTAVLQALGLNTSPCNFHLTIGQTENNRDSSCKFLLSKARLLPDVTLEVSSLAILIREKVEGPKETTSRMRLWGTIDMPGSSQGGQAPLNEFWLTNQHSFHDPPDSDEDEDVAGTVKTLDGRVTQSQTAYSFDSDTQNWCLSTPAESSIPSSFCVSSYNVLVGHEYTPEEDRIDILIDTILTNQAISDILVLQETSDDFLSTLLANEKVRQLYPFASHGPPSQPDISPLPSMRNVVILSRWSFDWKFVWFQRRHKGAIVASFDTLSTTPFVVAGVHLTCGLTSGSVIAKKVQMQNLIKYLKSDHASSPWIIAGDFNLTTSSYTIEEAVKSKTIPPSTVHTLESIEKMQSEAGILDSWILARVEGVDDAALLDADDLFEGEQGATFNPRENVLAAETSGTSNNRPQRYDRILFRPQGLFDIARYNQFGLPEVTEAGSKVGSDHSGIRASFKLLLDSNDNATVTPNTLHQCEVEHIHASAELSQTSDLHHALSQRAVFPTDEDEVRYQEAFNLLRTVISPPNEQSSSTEISLVVVPVGSYALNVWTPDSDIDCLCIGPISSKTFFQLARQRIRKAEPKGVRLLRKVEANTGTMLELSVNGVNMDLQYCPAANIAELWHDFAKFPSTSPIFNLPILSLRKLKPIRDLIYLQRTLPSSASFRLAYHFIKQWAVERGIYSSKFGYFGGVHITLMLSIVCKRLAHDAGSIGVGDIVLSFFHYYANFDWQNQMVYDPFFHKKKPRYQRSAREPVVILGFHAPNSNIAHTATAPGLEVLVSELKRADERLSTTGMSWEKFFDVEAPVGLGFHVKQFVGSHEIYARIDIQYWGRELSKGKGLVGWVESRCINLVVDIHRTLPHLSIRIYPTRFTDTATSTSSAYYHGCYLIGLSYTNPSNTPLSKEARQEAKPSLQKTFDRFLAQVQSDTKHYDESTSWLGISLAKPNDLHDLQPDDREWGEYTGDVDSDSDDESEDEDESEDATTSSLGPQRKLPLRTALSTQTTPVSTRKLRPASDILNRLRWDPSLTPSDFIVGYEDRFLGAKETSLERWKTEQTDEEFIPQHRILYFKKRGEAHGGEIVWERATRVDKIFGSGAGNGTEGHVE